MTTLLILAFASFAGALLFFAVGVAVAALWRSRQLVVPLDKSDPRARSNGRSNARSNVRSNGAPGGSC